MKGKTPASGAALSITEESFSFELLKPYPEARAFVIKKPLKNSVADAVLELLGGKR